jgi:hypothetical protein
MANSYSAKNKRREVIESSELFQKFKKKKVLIFM